MSQEGLESTVGKLCTDNELIKQDLIGVGSRMASVETLTDNNNASLQQLGFSHGMLYDILIKKGVITEEEVKQHSENYRKELTWTGG